MHLTLDDAIPSFLSVGKPLLLKHSGLHFTVIRHIAERYTPGKQTGKGK
jgi:hypothetical protein